MPFGGSPKDNDPVKHAVRYGAWFGYAGDGANR